MSDANAVRLVPLYRGLKELTRSITNSPGVWSHAAALQDLVEQAILTDGKVLKLQAEIAANDLLISARLMVERAEAIKAKLDEVAG